MISSRASAIAHFQNRLMWLPPMMSALISPFVPGFLQITARRTSPPAPLLKREGGNAADNAKLRKKAVGGFPRPWLSCHSLDWLDFASASFVCPSCSGAEAEAECCRARRRRIAWSRRRRAVARRGPQRVRTAGLGGICCPRDRSRFLCHRRRKRVVRSWPWSALPGTSAASPSESSRRGSSS